MDNHSSFCLLRILLKQNTALPSTFHPYVSQSQAWNLNFSQESDFRPYKPDIFLVHIIKADHLDHLEHLDHFDQSNHSDMEDNCRISIVYLF